MNFKPKLIENQKAFKSEFVEAENKISLGFGEVQTVTELVGGEIYTGNYSVVPLVEPQILATKYKVLNDNVTIHEIPYAEVSNDSGGTTATIG